MACLKIWFTKLTWSQAINYLLNVKQKQITILVQVIQHLTINLNLVWIL